jgi:hypothetical protein
MAEEQELEADVCPSETGKGKAHSDIPQNRNSTVTPPWEVMCKPRVCTPGTDQMLTPEIGRA